MRNAVRFRPVMFFILAVSLFVGIFAACRAGKQQSAGEAKALKVGLVTGAGALDDNSFNQGAWEGMQMARDDFMAEIMYVKPSGGTADDYDAAIGNLAGAGVGLIVCPGNMLGSSLGRYPDVNFVLLESGPRKTGDVPENCVALSFAGHEGPGFTDALSAAVYGAVKAALNGGFPGGQRHEFMQ